MIPTNKAKLYVRVMAVAIVVVYTVLFISMLGGN